MPGSSSAEFTRKREHMVERQIAARGIADPAVLAAMRTVPRHRFVPPDLAWRAYDDSALPIAEGQTISQPYIVALMAEAAKLSPDDRVLEVGAGSGYAAAVLGEIAGQVIAVERHAALASAARERLEELGYVDIVIRTGDGSLGLPEEAPFDAILVAAGAPAVPRALKEQLAPGGRLVIPVGGGAEQRLLKIVRHANDQFTGQFTEEELGLVRFVPLIGEGAGGTL